MNKRAVLIIVIVAILAIGGIFAGYIGLLSTISIEKQEIGPYYFVVEDYIGPYDNINNEIKKVGDKLQEEGFNFPDGFAIIRNDPETSMPEKQVSQIGKIVPEKYVSQIADLERLGFKVFKMGFTLSGVVNWPIRTPLSTSIGKYRVHGLLKDFVKNENLGKVGLLELYYTDHILFSVEIKKLN